MWRLVAEQLKPRWVAAFAVLATAPAVQAVAHLWSPASESLGGLGPATAVIMLLFSTVLVYIYLTRDARQMRTVLLKTLPASTRTVAWSKVLVPAVQLLVLATATLVPAVLLGIVAHTGRELGSLLSLVAVVLAVHQLELLSIELRPRFHRLRYGRLLAFVVPGSIAAAIAFSLARFLSHHADLPTVEKLILLLQPAAGIAALALAVAIASLTVLLFLRRESYVSC